MARSTELFLAVAKTNRYVDHTHPFWGNLESVVLLTGFYVDVDANDARWITFFQLGSRPHRVRFRREQQMLVLVRPGERKEHSMGHLDGCTTVLHFSSEAAYCQFTETDMAPIDLTRRHIGFEWTDRRYVYIGWVLHLASLVRAKSPTASSLPLVLHALRHVAHELPPGEKEMRRRQARSWVRRTVDHVARVLARRRMVVKEPADLGGQRYPKFVCCARTDEMVKMLQKLGFEYYGRSWDGHGKFVLDLNELDDPHLESGRRRMLLRALKLAEFARQRGDNGRISFWPELL